MRLDAWDTSHYIAFGAECHTQEMTTKALIIA